MLHTLHSINNLEENSSLVLDKSHYNIFDSRSFRFNKSLEEIFASIETRFIVDWNNTIKPFLDAFIYNHEIYDVKPGRNITLIPEEGIYMKLQGLDSSDIKYFYSTNKLRLIGIDTNKIDKDASLSIFNSAVFSPIRDNHYDAISIIIYKSIFKEYKDNKIKFNEILLRIANLIALNYIDDILQFEYNVPVNRILSINHTDSNKDAIILPESLNISDARFIFSYFYTLFRCLLAVLNNDYVYYFTDYSTRISLPTLFKFDMTDEEANEAEAKLASMSKDEQNIYSLGFMQKIYKRIWELARKGNPVSDQDYIDICAKVMEDIEVNLDRSFYENMDEFNGYEESNFEDEE